jgi:hypothetical protein
MGLASKLGSGLLFLTLSISPLTGQNALHNGDFEEGFAGWSYGAWWGGSYEFTPATEPYTGDYSAFIHCIAVGSEAKALLNADFVADEGETYTLSFWHKGTEAGIPERAIIFPDYVGDLWYNTETGWKRETLTFTLPAGDPMLGFYHLGDAGTGIYIDHVIINKGDSVIDDSSKPEAYKGIPSIVTADEYVVRIDGCPIFPISAYNMSSVQDTYDAGFNCVMGFFGSYNIPMMDEAFEFGLPVIVGGMTGMLRSHLPEKAGPYAQLYMNHPATFVHYMVDEPDHDLFYVAPEEVKQAHESIHAVDENHPTMLLQMNWSLIMGSKYDYSQSSDIFACDPYVIHSGQGVAKLELDMQRIRSFAANRTKPVWLAIEGGWEETGELTREEQYGTAWTPIVNNVNGLFFFSYDFLEAHPEQLQAVRDITAEVRHIEGALTSPVSTLPEKVDKAVVWYSRQSPGGLIIFAANIRNESKEGITIKHEGITAVSTVIDVFDKRRISPSDGFFTDNFAPYERHVYAVDAEPHFCLIGPRDGAADVNPNTKIKIMVIDEKDGIDAETVNMAVNDVAVEPQVQIDAFGGVRVIFDPEDPLPGSVDVNVSAENNTGQYLSHRWSFNTSGATRLSEHESEELIRSPHRFMLSQNFPNPFNPSTEICYQLSQEAEVKLEVFNLVGQRIVTLVQKRQPAGLHRVFWNGRIQTGTQSPNGVYFYRIDAVYDKGRFTDMKKMILLR